VMLASMTACGTTPSSPTTASTEAATVATTTAATTAAASTEATTTAASSAEATPATTPLVTITALVSLLPWVTDIVNNDYTKELEAKTNVHLDMTVVPSDSYQDKLNLLLTSGDYPEVIMSGGFDNGALMKYGAKEKILIPLNDLIEKNSVYLKEKWAERPNFKQEMTAPDGNIYGLPSMSDAVGHGAVSFKLWLNQAWVDKLGLKTPTTTQEFKDVLTAFKTKDPNGNGKADEIPLSGAIKTWAADPYWFLINAFTYFDGSLLMLKDDKFTFTADTDGFKEGLRYVADLYNNGLIDPAAFTQNLDQLGKLGNNPDTVILGAATCGHIAMAFDINNKERAKQYSALLPLKGTNGYQGIPYARQVHVSGAQWVITDKCKNPEVAFKVADMLYSTDEFLRYEYGVKGTQWGDADPGTFGMDGKTPAKYKPLTWQGSTSATNTYRWSGTSIWASPKDFKNLWQSGEDIYDPLNYEKRLVLETLKFEPFAANVQEITPLFVDADTSAMISQLFTPINDFVTASMVEFITGKKSLDKDWAAYLADLEKLKYKDFVAAQQGAFDSMKK
jgi:putative aldouronate transport system substrate-binding protein